MKYAVVVLMALTNMGFDRVSLAQTQPLAAPGTTADERSPRAPATMISGKVTSVDAKAGAMTVKVKDQEIHLTTDSKSTKAALEKLKVGEVANVFERGGKVIAASPLKAKSQNTAAR